MGVQVHPIVVVLPAVAPVPAPTPVARFGADPVAVRLRTEPAGEEPVAVRPLVARAAEPRGEAAHETVSATGTAAPPSVANVATLPRDRSAAGRGPVRDPAEVPAPVREHAAGRALRAGLGSVGLPAGDRRAAPGVPALSDPQALARAVAGGVGRIGSGRPGRAVIARPGEAGRRAAGATIASAAPGTHAPETPVQDGAVTGPQALRHENGRAVASRGRARPATGATGVRSRRAASDLAATAALGGRAALAGPAGPELRAVNVMSGARTRPVADREGTPGRPAGRAVRATAASVAITMNDRVGSPAAGPEGVPRPGRPAGTAWTGAETVPVPGVSVARPRTARRPRIVARPRTVRRSKIVARPRTVTRAPVTRAAVMIATVAGATTVRPGGKADGSPGREADAPRDALAAGPAVAMRGKAIAGAGPWNAVGARTDRLEAGRTRNADRPFPKLWRSHKDHGTPIPISRTT